MRHVQALRANRTIERITHGKWHFVQWEWHFFRTPKNRNKHNFQVKLNAD